MEGGGDEGAYVANAFLFSVTTGVSGAGFRPDKGRGSRENVCAGLRKAPILTPTAAMRMLAGRSASHSGIQPASKAADQPVCEFLLVKKYIRASICVQICTAGCSGNAG